jgi:hypothetical protein
MLMASATNTRPRGSGRDRRPAHSPQVIATITTVFGTPLDVTVAELAIESFLLAEPTRKDYLRAYATADGASFA